MPDPYLLAAFRGLGREPSKWPHIGKANGRSEVTNFESLFGQFN